MFIYNRQYYAFSIHELIGPRDCVPKESHNYSTVVVQSVCSLDYHLAAVVNNNMSKIVGIKFNLADEMK